MPHARLRFSIEIETANLGLAELARLGPSLDSIAAQRPSPAAAEEAVLLIDDGLPRELVESLQARHSWLTTRRIAEGIGYGDQKALSASTAEAEILVLADSDCLYEPGWLAALLETCAEHPDAMVVAGETTIAITGPFTLAMALVYFFPRFSYETQPGPARGFFGNNVAFRTEVFARIPFPQGLPLHRGQNVIYSRVLLEKGATLMHEPRARSLHAPPESFRIAVKRLYWTGRDAGRLAGLRAVPPDQPFAGDYEPYRRPGGRARKVVERVKAIARQQPGMLLWLPLALPVALICAGAFFVGLGVERARTRAE